MASLIKVDTIQNAAGTAGPAVLGSITNDSAAAGYVGEFLSNQQARGTETTLSTGASANIFLVTSTNGTVKVPLTAGDWDIDAFVVLNLNNATTAAASPFDFSISKTSATLSGVGTFGNASNNGEVRVRRTEVFAAVTAEVVFHIPPIRASLATATDYYLVANVTFTGTGVTAYGCLRARRVR